MNHGLKYVWLNNDDKGSDGSEDRLSIAPPEISICTSVLYHLSPNKSRGNAGVVC
jgi:hypothetical protein